MKEKLFCYVIDFGSVSANDVIQKELAFASDSDFRLTQIRTNQSATTEANITLKTENGDQMSNAAFALRAIAGTTNPLNIFGGEQIFNKSSKITAIADVSAGTSQPLQLQLWGFKI